MLRKFNYDSMPVVEVVNEILIDSTKRGASDIHFDPLVGRMVVRIRIDGELMNYCEVPVTIQKNLITRVKIISSMNITETRLPQDGSVKSKIDNTPLDLRVSSIPTSNGEKIVVRILDYSLSGSGLENLGFSEENFRKVLKMMAVPNGIILVTGATGTGKSTTVYAVLQRLNKENTNIITVEDPIEMDIEGINQIQTNSEIGLDFATALRSILRQDPNIIMVGEIRDTETAKIAVRASITGHLVLSTLHTNDSLNTIERLLDMDVERYLLASSLTGIISQKLARRLCKCKVQKPTNEYEKKMFKKVLNKDVTHISVNEGCELCDNGYKGRVAIHEVLIINQDIRDAISSGIKKEYLRDLVFKADVTTLLQDGLTKVLEGLTTMEEVVKLIELGDVESDSGDIGLQAAIDYTDISHQAVLEKASQTIKNEDSPENPELPSNSETKPEVPKPIEPQVESKPVDPKPSEPQVEEPKPADNSKISELLKKAEVATKTDDFNIEDIK